MVWTPEALGRAAGRPAPPAAPVVRRRGADPARVYWGSSENSGDVSSVDRFPSWQAYSKST